jgi:hypothetical protein
MSRSYTSSPTSAFVACSGTVLAFMFLRNDGIYKRTRLYNPEENIDAHNMQLNTKHFFFLEILVLVIVLSHQ